MDTSENQKTLGPQASSKYPRDTAGRPVEEGILGHSIVYSERVYIFTPILSYFVISRVSWNFNG